MKNNSLNKKADSPLHIKDIAHSRKRSVRIVLKFFVWILIISFVTTIGVTWGGNGASYGNIISTKHTKLDLSPGGFFIRERENVYQNILTQNSNADPRRLNERVNEVAFERSKALALRNDFFTDIKLAPSPEMRETYRQNSGIASPAMISYYYGLQNIHGGQGGFNQLALLGILGEPTISDIYAVNDISRLEIAAEGIVLSITNFYASKVPLEEKEAFYIKNAALWADRVVAASFSTDSRSNAFELAKAVTNKADFTESIKLVREMIAGKGRWSNTTYKEQELFSPEDGKFELFRAGVKAYQNKKIPDFGVSEPIYQNGSYTILVVTSLGSYEALNPFIQQMMNVALVAKNYKELNRQHKAEWQAALQTVKTSVAEGKSFAEISEQAPGLLVDVSDKFNPLSEMALSLSGAPFAAPVLEDPRLMSSLLITKKPELFADKNNADTHYAVRALQIKTPTQKELQIDPAAAFTNTALLQNIYGYRVAQLDQGLSYGLEGRYKLKSNRALLTNFTAAAGE